MKEKHFTIVVIIITVIGFFLNASFFNEFPSFTHAWAQSDRFALALGFENNGFNFFKPETFVLNHQFPDNWETPSNTSITAVDFPIHEYIIALFMKIFHSNSPLIFRGYIFIYSIIGMTFLYKTVSLLTNSRISAILILFIGISSPIFVYYQNGFLPTIPSLSNGIIGVYFYLKYIKFALKKHLTISFIFLVLAALSRTTFLVLLVSVCCSIFFKCMKERENVMFYFKTILISFLILFSYLLYNHFLREEYGSIFLNQLLPIHCWNHLIDVVTAIKNNWLFHYFSRSHYWIFLLIILQFLYFKLVKHKEISKLQKVAFRLVGWLFLGNILFFIVMGQQFQEHDYYFLDTFFLPILLLFSVLLSTITSIQKRGVTFLLNGAVILSVFPLIISAQKIQILKRETGSWDRIQTTNNNFSQSEDFLNELNIPTSSKILVLDAYAPNIPFIKMNRKGFVVMTTSKENIINALKWDIDYVVFQNEFFISDIYSNFPEIINYLKIISSNGKITICKLENSNQSLDSFFSIESTTPIFKSNPFLDCNDWYENEMGEIVKLSKKEEFKLTFKKQLEFLSSSSSLVKLSTTILKTTNIPIQLVVAIDENGKNTLYQTYNLSDMINQINKFDEVELYFNLPKTSTSQSKFSLYVWNPSGGEAEIKTFQFEVYQR
jgi:hypothetical protein